MPGRIGHARRCASGPRLTSTETRVTISAPDGADVAVRLIIQPKARRIGLRIDPIAREAVAFAPSKRSLPAALAFAKERSGWLAMQLQALRPRTILVPDARIPILGQPTRLEATNGRGLAWLDPGPPPRFIIPCPDGASFEARAQRGLRALALMALTEELRAPTALFGVQPHQVRIKDTRSRWGSCTSSGVLSFSWRVVMAPLAVLRYLAVHEAAHLREMNHSPAFWSLVAKADPDYRRARAWLRAHGAGLHAIG